MVEIDETNATYLCFLLFLYLYLFCLFLSNMAYTWAYRALIWKIQSIVGIYFLRFMERSLELSISILLLHIGYSIFLEVSMELQGSWLYSISFVAFFGFTTNWMKYPIKDRFWSLKQKNVKKKKQIDRREEEKDIEFVLHYKHMKQCKQKRDAITYVVQVLDCHWYLLLPLSK